MKKVLIVGSRKSGTKNNPAVMAEQLRSHGVEVAVVFWEQLIFSIATDAVHVTYDGHDILDTTPDMVIALGWYKNGKKSVYRDVAYSLALYMDYHQVRFWNSEMLFQRSTTKLSTMMQLALANVSVPTTYFSLDVSLVSASIPLPYIAKAVAASRGESNYLVEQDSDIRAYIDQGDYMLIQPYLLNNHDLRVICFNGKPELILRRARAADASTHLNNTSKGGSARWLQLDEVPPELLTLSEKICKITKREMAGIDFIPDVLSDVGYSCLEVNAVPQLTSGTDTDKKIEALARALNKL